MLFTTPRLGAQEEHALGQVEEVKDRLKTRLFEPRRWTGSLRKLSLARAIRGSNTIEGYTADLDDAAAIVLNEAPISANEATKLALQGYRDAMTYVLQLADDPEFSYGPHIIKSLHFMMLRHDLSQRPGLWRTGTTIIRDDETGDVVYEGADVDLVPELIDELAAFLNSEDEPDLVSAAMAHLNLVMIHPFRDGNGRMARCLQSLVLAREGTLYPPFMSIEEYLGRNTRAYCDILEEVGQGAYHPENDAMPWVRFAITAHWRQATQMHKRIVETELLWGEVEEVITRRGLNGRTVVAVADAAWGLKVRNATYRAFHDDSDTGITENTASRDLRSLVDAGLLKPHGQKRGRFYTAGDQVVAIRRKVLSGDEWDESDPFGR